ncbi:MAG: hypothetical protein H7844_14370 [Nitrospirae bacterium YQR-1]
MNIQNRNIFLVFMLPFFVLFLFYDVFASTCGSKIYLDVDTNGLCQGPKSTVTSPPSGWSSLGTNCSLDSQGDTSSYSGSNYSYGAGWVSTQCNYVIYYCCDSTVPQIENSKLQSTTVTGVNYGDEETAAYTQYTADIALLKSEVAVCPTGYTTGAVKTGYAYDIAYTIGSTVDLNVTSWYRLGCNKTGDNVTTMSDITTLNGVSATGGLTKTDVQNAFTNAVNNIQSSGDVVKSGTVAAGVLKGLQDYVASGGTLGGGSGSGGSGTTTNNYNYYSYGDNGTYTLKGDNLTREDIKEGVMDALGRDDNYTSVKATYDSNDLNLFNSDVDNITETSLKSVYDSNNSSDFINSMKSLSITTSSTVCSFDYTIWGTSGSVDFCSFQSVLQSVGNLMFKFCTILGYLIVLRGK